MISGGNALFDTAIVGAGGGLASVLTGGKFENGFVTAAFANLYNKWSTYGSDLRPAGSSSDLSYRIQNRGLPGTRPFDNPCGSFGHLASAGGGVIIACGGGGGGATRGLGNPFKGKTPQEIDGMFRTKGFELRGPDPAAGRGTYVHPNTGRGYHIDAGRPPPKGPHVGVHRPRGKRLLPPRDYQLEGE